MGGKVTGLEIMVDYYCKTGNNKTGIFHRNQFRADSILAVQGTSPVECGTSRERAFSGQNETCKFNLYPEDFLY